VRSPSTWDVGDPRHRRRCPTPHPPPAFDSPATPRPTPANGTLLLVAEDNVINQRVATALLTKRGYTIDLAANGREAVDMYLRGEYQAIFMDCQMPTLDGYDATAEIRRHEGADSHIPIIAMTANTMTGDRERCLAAGMDDYIAKPVRPDALDQVIARTLPDTANGVPGPAALQVANADDAPPMFEASLLNEARSDDEQAPAQPWSAPRSSRR